MEHHVVNALIFSSLLQARHSRSYTSKGAHFLGTSLRLRELSESKPQFPIILSVSKCALT